MAIYVCGDTHHDLDIQKLYEDSFIEGNSLTKDDFVIVLGDFGLLWYNTLKREEIELLEFYNSRPWTTLWLPGNHENYDRIADLSRVSKFGDVVGYRSKSILMLETGHIYNICGKNIFVFGGGESIDRKSRIPGISWWQEEIPSNSQFEEGMLRIDTWKLNHPGEKIDFVLSHTCPKTVFMELVYQRWTFGLEKSNDPTMVMLDRFLEILGPEIEAWHFGHMHIEWDWGIFHCHYERTPVKII